MANRDSFDDYETEEQDDGFLTFDARDEEEDRTRGPLVIAAIVAVLALCGVILWQLYQGSRSGDETPQIAADTGSFKAAPVDPGGAAADDLDKGVFDAGDGTVAPPLDVLPATSGAEDPLLADADAIPPPAPAPTQVAKAPVATPPPVQQVVPKPTPKPTPKPEPVAVAKATPKPAPAPVRVAQSTPQIAVATPPKAPVQVAERPAAAASDTPAPKAAATSSGIGAQLGSFQTRASADAALAGYKASGLSGPVSVVAANLGAKGTWYRIRATGFDTRAEVDSFCAKARSAGAQCIASGR
jgi:outer membrane biosynthesis protein TonB